VIKGVLIFGAGIGVGYGIAVANDEEALKATTETLTAFKNIMNDAWLDQKLETAERRKQEAEEQKVARQQAKDAARAERAKAETEDEPEEETTP
jgi:predicted phage tail protein